jgi:serine/threonine-protein kinase
MGEVYEAEDTVKERVVALKLLSVALSQDPVFRERLQREARTAGRLHEPHVVPIHDYGEIDGQLFLDMRLIQGTDLSMLLKKSGTLTPPRAVNIVHQAASALDAAHAVGVIHRDIKPENVLITGDDFVYLVDFGIASATADERLTPQRTAVGTWKYSAPERFTTAEVSHSIDIYALACLLHECLTGSPPYRADTTGMLITAHLMEPIPRPSQLASGVPITFDGVIARGMAKDPKDRYASAGELAKAAYQALNSPDQDRAGRIFERSQKSAGPIVDHARQHTVTPAPSAGVPVRTPSSVGSVRSDVGRPAPNAPVFPTGSGAWPDQLPPRRPVPLQRKRKPKLRPWVAALVAVVMAGVLVIWLVNRAHSGQSAANMPTAEPRPTTSASPSTTSVPTAPAAETQARLFRLLPAGYPPKTCKPISPPANTLAKVSCGKNTDPDGPASAVYTLFPDADALDAGFNTMVESSTIVDCPGRIQSPGSWHRAASPDKPSGMLLCGTRQDHPTVVWTNDADLLICVVQADQSGPTLEQLYAWWSAHS